MTTRSPPAPVAAFIVAGWLPAILLIAGAVAGGPWVWAGVVWMAIVAPLADMLAGLRFGDDEGDDHHPGAVAHNVALAVLHLIVLAAMLAALSRPGLTLASRAALMVGAGMFFGQISHANAHELIHRPRRWLFRLGAAVYVSLLFGHHVSAHRLVHHPHVATDADPNSARLGESFWQFMPRAWWGSFRAGRAAERGRRAYAVWVGGAAVMVVAVGALFGARVLADYLLVCAYAQMQILLSDYVQHYGLSRDIRNGRPVPVGARHSWDSPHPLYALMTVNAPRHSDHHAHPMRHYPALRLDAGTRPMLPYPLSVMGAIALIPPLWRRLMDRRVARMSEQ